MNAGRSAESEERQMRPSWKNELNINTVVIVVGFIVIGVGWGVTWQKVVNGQQTNARDIAQLRDDVSQLKTDARAFDNIRFRVERLEDGFVGITANTRDLEKTINAIASDIRVMREIVERLDKKDRADAAGFIRGTGPSDG